MHIASLANIYIWPIYMFAMFVCMYLCLLLATMCANGCKLVQMYAPLHITVIGNVRG